MSEPMQLERIDAYRWRVPRHGGMRTDGLIFADDGLIRDLEGDPAVQQVDALYRTIPSGVGASRSDVRLGRRDLERVLRDGARWVVAQGYGSDADLEAIEANGSLPGADPECVSDRAKERGGDQLGTVGSGNHFVEVGYVAERYDATVADRLGLAPGTVTVFIHSGSRGPGYQVFHDHLA